MLTICDQDLITRYPTPLIRGVRLARLGEQYIGPALSDTSTCRTLGEEQIGWFVGGVPTFDRMMELVRRVDSAKTGGRWIVVPATRFLADVAHQIWNEEYRITRQNKTCLPWLGERVTFCVPEQLSSLSLSHEDPVAGIILLDPNCIVHCGRSFGNGKSRIVHDRPQMIVDFRAKLGIGRWSPPLVIFSIHKAAAVATETVSRIYGLEAMHFIEGATLRCGEPPAGFARNLAETPGHVVGPSVI
jgi:hypothetical protein